MLVVVSDSKAFVAMKNLLRVVHISCSGVNFGDSKTVPEVVIATIDDMNIPLHWKAFGSVIGFLPRCKFKELTECKQPGVWDPQNQARFVVKIPSQTSYVVIH